MSILEVSGLRKVYTTRFGGSQVEALRNVNFSVEEGEYVAIMGESGSGKTTLLNILAALDRPTDGSVLLDGKDLSAVREQEAAAFRREQLGFDTASFSIPANSLKTAGRRIRPCLSTSQVAALPKRKRENLRPAVLVIGNARSFSSNAVHSELSYTKRQLSSPFVITNSSPNCSLNLEGTIRRPFASTV